MFLALKKLLNAVFNPTWKLKCISVSSNGARNMTGCTNSLVTCISYHCDPGIIQIWCGLHQLDLVMQQVFKPAFDGTFYSTLTSLIGYLWHQQNLIIVMPSTCPKVADTWWISIHSTTKWLVKHRLCVRDYLNDKTPLCAPNTLWWDFLHAVHGFAFESKIVFISLQGLITIVSEQQRHMSGLIKTYCQMTGMLGPLTSEQVVSSSAESPAAVSGSFFYHMMLLVCI